VFGHFETGSNPAIVDAYVIFGYGKVNGADIDGLSGDYAEYNGRMIKILAVSGNQVTIDLDTSGEAAAFSGTANAFFLVDKGDVTASVSGNVLTITDGPFPKQFDYVGYGNNFGQVSSPRAVENEFNLFGGAPDASSQTMKIFMAPVNYMNDFRFASKQSPLIKDMTIQNFEDLTTMPGGSYPSVYYLAGGRSIWSNWYPDYDDEENVPVLWQAVLDFQGIT
jgi:hypothetical protein